MLLVQKSDLAKKLSQIVGENHEKVLSLFERPKSLDHGHISFPVFFLAKTLRKAPPVIAKEVAEEINKSLPEYLLKVEAVSGFVNFTLTAEALQGELEAKVLQVSEESLGFSSHGDGQRVVIDFASPNVAKPMHVGHLRATMIGQAIYNLAKTQGYDVLGVNHLGDWGVQFGKLAWAYKKWGSEYPFDKEPFDSLTKLYVRFHAEAEKDDNLNKEGSLIFKQLEDGDEEIHKLWKMFVDITMEKNNKLFELLGVKHDLVRGESYYNDRLKGVEKLLEGKGLLVESDGAMVVEMGDDMPPCLIRKADGASLYATRDIASAIHRKEDLGGDLNLYVVAIDQNLHFKQVFKVLEKMGYEWSSDCHHISFGMYRFKDQGKMSSRRGNIITLEDVLDKAISSVESLIEERKSDLANKSEVAKQVGVGAIIFNDLINDRVKNVDFDWDRALDFNGDSGPYVQYSHVRCNSILNKSDKTPKFDVLLDSKEEQALMFQLLQYSRVLESAFSNFKPHLLASYLLDVCRVFGDFYHKHRIIGGDESKEAARLALVLSTKKVLKSALAVLNIQAPEEM